MSGGRELTFHSDPLNEREVLAAEIVGREFRKEMVRHLPDTFLTPEHQGLPKAVREAEHRGLEPTPAVLVRLSNGEVDVRYVEELIAAHPDLPPADNLAEHVALLLWDRQKQVAITGPIDQLLQAIAKNEPPERVRGLARAVSATFDGWGDRNYQLDNGRLVDDVLSEIDRRATGQAIHAYGIKGLDFFEDGRRRMVPGVADGQVTVVTGLPGSGKSTTTARIVLGQIRKKRKVAYGCWEMKGRVTLELLACISLAEKDDERSLGDWSRVKMQSPRDYPGWWTPDRRASLRTRMEQLVPYVSFIENPFRRHAGKSSNERNLDAIAGYIADTGCKVAVFDLWKRCLVSAKPEDEEDALTRQQAMIEELGVHGILVQQQRLKDIEMRADKKPTREGIKGSGAWVEIADTIIGVHRPALWKPIPDDVLELDILKQRYGEWPLAIEFAWDPKRGIISGGTAIDYDVVSRSGGATSNPLDVKINEKKAKKQ